jgi:predicted phosphodiesterase
VRYGIISDIHGNLEAFEAALAALSREKIDQYLCVGDIVGYGANPVECIVKTRALTPFIVCGNHDIASSGLAGISAFNEAAKKAVVWTRNNLNRESVTFLKGLNFLYKNEHVILVHGTLEEPEAFHYMSDGYDADRTFRLMGNTRICFVGHSHVPGIFSRRAGKINYFCKEKTKLSKDEKLIVNVGSVGQPRDGDPRLSYAVYDTDRNLIELKRAAYDIKTAQEKIRKTGLPPFLADRLGEGV